MRFKLPTKNDDCRYFTKKEMNKTLLAIMLSLFSLGTWAQNSDDIVGVWWTEEKDGKVEIYQVGDLFYGKLIWMDEPTENGRPKRDEENPDPELRQRPIKGITLLKKLEFDDGEWEDGEIYDPESGDTYSCHIEMESKNRLKLRGYIGFSLVGRSTYWTRVED